MKVKYIYHTSHCVLFHTVYPIELTSFLCYQWLTSYACGIYMEYICLGHELSAIHGIKMRLTSNLFQNFTSWNSLIHNYPGWIIRKTLVGDPLGEALSSLAREASKVCEGHLVG